MDTINKFVNLESFEMITNKTGGALPNYKNFDNIKFICHKFQRNDIHEPTLCNFSNFQIYKEDKFRSANVSNCTFFVEIYFVIHELENLLKHTEGFPFASLKVKITSLKVISK